MLQPFPKIHPPERIESTARILHCNGMPQSLAKILVHAVFSTKERRPFLNDKILREELYLYLGGALTNLDCQPIIVGGVEDHVHLLCALPHTGNAPDIIREVKRGSASWLKTKDQDLKEFAWQNGCGIFSIGFSQIKSARDFIARQEAHHRKISFQDEFRQFLRRYEIEFDERSVWD